MQSAVALQPEAIAVVLDLVEPVGAGGDDLRAGGDAELEHASEIVRGGVLNSTVRGRLKPEDIGKSLS
jgi:hypothetical protein